MPASKKNRPRIIDVAAPPRLVDGPGIHTWSNPSRVAVVANWTDKPQVSRSVSEFVAQLDASGYRVAVCSASDVPDRLQWPHGRPGNVSVYRRPNIGYDFGTWASMLHSFPAIRAANYVLLANDSLVGPFAPITPILDSFENEHCDVWGLVNTAMAGLHLQSFFVGYKNGALRTSGMRRFWKSVRIEPTKWDLILRYEVGLYPVLQAAGLRIGVGFPFDLVVNPGQNPTISGWRRLLLYGFPWIKRELLLRPPHQAPDAAHIRRVVQDMFGQDIEDWY